MAKSVKRRINRVISIIAGVVLTVGLMPSLAFAGEEAAGQETGMAPQSTHKVTVSGGKAETAKEVGTWINVEVGDTVVLDAYNPSAGMGFVEWSGKWGENNLDITNRASAKGASFVMPGQDVAVSAILAKILVTNYHGSYVYTGEPIVPQTSDIKVELEGVDSLVGTVIENDEYTIEASNNMNAGKGAVATVTLASPRIGSTNYEFEIAPEDINKTNVSVANQEYTGKPLEPKPTVTFHDKAVSEDDYTLTYSKNVNLGTATVTVTGQNNFTGTTSATFEVVPRKLAVTADSAQREYNGKPLTATFSGDGLAEGDSIASAKVEGSQTDVGTSTCKVSDAKVVNAKGEDVTDCYDITYKSGTLTVTPAKATITVASASKVEGEADPAFTGTIEGLLAEGDLGVVAYKRTNVDEAPGIYKGVITATYTANANYDATVKNGDFTIMDKGTYEAVSGSGSTWAEHSAEALTFTFKRTADDETTLDHFAGVLVDGEVVPAKNHSGNPNWTAAKGSLVLSLQPAYLNTLPAGDHIVTALFDDGSAEAAFKVTATPEPTPEPTPTPVAKHVVTFDANGHGAAPAAQEVQDGEVASKPADPTAEGWEFGGWYTDGECKQAYDFSSPVTSDLTLYAKWTQKATPAAGTDKKATSPKTGDTLPLRSVMVLLLLSSIALAVSGAKLQPARSARRGKHAR